MKDFGPEMLPPDHLGVPKESWLAGGDTDDDHWRFGIAMSKCQDASGSCASKGECTFGGDCFRSASSAAREAASLIKSISSDSHEVTGWLNDAAEWLNKRAKE